MQKKKQKEPIWLMIGVSGIYYLIDPILLYAVYAPWFLIAAVNFIEIIFRFSKKTFFFIKQKIKRKSKLSNPFVIKIKPRTRKILIKA